METDEQVDFYNQTVLHPLGLTAVLVLGVAMLLVPRKYALIPMAIMACFIAPAQRIALFTLNFDLLRVMVVFGMIRVLAWGEWRGLRLRPLDIAVFVWALVGTVAFSILFWTAEALKFRLGQSYDIVGVYLLGRCLIREWSDVDALVKGFVVISVPVALAFLIEHATGRNAFAMFGGVPAITDIRENRLRCQGAFAHPILAGCFWASLMPLILVQWWRPGRSRLAVLIGLVCMFIIIMMCASSTPIAALMFGGIGLGFYFMRTWMQRVSWAVCLMLFGLHLVMNAPVWHLLARIDLAGGSTGWYRYLLFDEWIKHFNEWWLVGEVSTEHWGAQYGLKLYDITNQFVLEGIRGGLLTVLLFIVVLMAAFRDVGRAWRGATGNLYHVLLVWALGVSLFIHCTDFLAVSYFGQIRFLYYLLLAAIGSVAAISEQKIRRPAAVRVHKDPVLRNRVARAFETAQ